MKDNTEEIDKLIKETLTQEEAKFYNNLDEEGLFASIKRMFKGKFKWIILMMLIVNFVIIGFFIYAIIQFFEAEEIKEIIKWSAASFICILILSMLKVFSWMQMNKNALLREMKRLELLIASSHSKI